MVKKIIVVEVIEHVYTPNVEDPHGVYAEHDIPTVEDALIFDKKDVDEGAAQLHELAEESKSISRTWRIIEEP